MNIYTFCPRDRFGSNTYLVEIDGEYAVIDPSVDYETVRLSHDSIDGKVKFILLTHAHFDHMLAIDSWAEQCQNVYVGTRDAAALSDSYLNCYLGFMGVRDGYFGKYSTVGEGDILELGGERITVIDCPGHTPGGVSYRIGDSLFVGDTAFAGGGYGRCDLPGGDIDALEKTLIRLITREKEATLYPGHGPSTTLTELIHHFR